jgi:osmotically-inducible protein OsmY
MKKLLLIPVLCLGLFSCCHECKDKNGNPCVKSEDQSSDWSITTRVKSAILTDTSIAAMARFVSVSTTDGVVTLTGSVATREDREKIVKIVKNVQGVKSVDNQITISK